MSGDIDGREGYLAGLENQGGADGVVEAAEIEAEHLEAEEAEDQDQINPDDTDQDISDAVAAKMIDDMNWRQKTGHRVKKFVRGTLSHIWKNKAQVALFTIIPAGVGIALAEGVSAATGGAVPRHINYPLAVAFAYPLTAGLRFAFEEATIAWAGLKDGLSRTKTVDKSKTLQKFFGHRRRFSDISDTKAGRNNGTYLGVALTASIALFGSQYVQFAKDVTLGLPETSVRAFNAVERAVNPNEAVITVPDEYAGELPDVFTQDPLPEGMSLKLVFDAPEPAPEVIEETPEVVAPEDEIVTPDDQGTQGLEGSQGEQLKIGGPR